jgi:uncharacterized protein
MKFWDSSAIVPLLLREPMSDGVKGVLTADPQMVVWWASRTECVSALARRARDGGLGLDGQAQARRVLSALATAWAEIQPTDYVRQRAERLLAVHRLRAADAFQLAAALTWAQETTAGLDIVCLDDNLSESALKEGFAVVSR